MKVRPSTLGFLRDLGAPARLWALAEEEGDLRGLRANTHVHLPPNFSAFASAAEAVSLAASAGLHILGAGNYYDFSVYRTFAAEARQHAILPLFGIELISMADDLRASRVRVNDPVNPGKAYICGKGIVRFDQPSEEALETLSEIRRADEKRMREMISRLSSVFAQAGVDLGLDEAAVVAACVSRSPAEREGVTLQERHVALAFQEALFARLDAEGRRRLFERFFGESESRTASSAPIVQELIRSRLMKAGKPAFVEESFINVDEGRSLVLQLGGIPCYPVLADGAGACTEFEEDTVALAAKVRGMGFAAAEFIPVRNRPEVLAEYVLAMRKAGLFVTAGTEHNTLDLLPLEPTAAGGSAVPPEVAEIFGEGALVVAAHEFLAAHGETGFVDEKGAPNESYADDNERIKAFARLGAAVVKRYREVYGRSNAGRHDEGRRR